MSTKFLGANVHSRIYFFEFCELSDFLLNHPVILDQLRHLGLCNGSGIENLQ